MGSFDMRIGDAGRVASEALAADDIDPYARDGDVGRASRDAEAIAGDAARGILPIRERVAGDPGRAMPEVKRETGAGIGTAGSILSTVLGPATRRKRSSN